MPICAERVRKPPRKIGFDDYAIGGVSVGEPEPEMLLAVENCEPFLPNDKPRYAIGIGTPPQLIELIARVDMFDCILPTRLARNGTAFTAAGTLNLKNAEFALQQVRWKKATLVRHTPIFRAVTSGT